MDWRKLGETALENSWNHAAGLGCFRAVRCNDWLEHKRFALQCELQLLEIRVKRRTKASSEDFFSWMTCFHFPPDSFDKSSVKNIAASCVTVRLNSCGSSQQEKASSFSDLPEKSRNKYYISADLGSITSGVPGCSFFCSAIIVTDCILAW